MTIKGDMVATLMSKGETHERARELVAALLDCADGADFAARYAAERERGNDAQLEYWGVINFLKTMA